MLRKTCAAAMALVALFAVAGCQRAKADEALTDISARRHVVQLADGSFRYVKTRKRKHRVAKARSKQSHGRKSVTGAVTPKELFCTADPVVMKAMDVVPLNWQPIIRPVRASEPMSIWELALVDEVADARAYLLRTASPGGTMTEQGPANSIAKLHPVFAVRLARAIREARANGLPEVGIFSAWRDPHGHVGGFADKTRSWHGAGMAVDVKGIGGPGSREAVLWYRIAGRNKLFNPYGPYNRAEFNHYQPNLMVGTDAAEAVRTFLVRKVKIDFPKMWASAASFIRNAIYVGPAQEPRARYAKRHGTRYARHHGTRYAARAARKHYARRHHRIRYAGAA